MRPLVLALLTGLGIAACDASFDIVTDDYATLRDARSDRLFERGWLPDILPESTTRIRTVNNLDINTSTGEFSLSSVDSAALFGRLEPGAPKASRFADWQRTVARYDRKGHSAWHYSVSGTNWAFFCEPSADRCEYYAWAN